MFFSRIDASRPKPVLDQRRKNVNEMTATGIEALTVRPTFSTRYNDEAPKMIPKMVPRISPRKVSSGAPTPGTGGELTLDPGVVGGSGALAMIAGSHNPRNGLGQSGSRPF